MKYTGFEDIDAGVRSVILISVAAAYFAFDIGFELGAHGSIFFEFAVVVVSFQYVIYVITSVIYPDFLKIQRAAPKIGIAVVMGTLVLAGFLVGANHNRFLTCEDFELSGQHVPADCRPG
jgi:hypothetical protein